MYIEKRKVSQQEARRLAIIANIIIVGVFLVLFFSFWYVQVLKNQYYTTLAAMNILKEIEIKAPRGLILDRHHRRLSENKINFSLFLTREFTQDLDRTLEAAAAFTGMDKTEVVKAVNKFRGFPKSYAIPIKRNVPLSQVIYIESRSDEYPEFEIHTEPARAYPLDTLGSHVLGYISELTAEELKEKTAKGYKLGDYIGKSGIEYKYEKYLRGTSGVRKVIKDNLGKVREILAEEDPRIGRSVVLTIDLELQQFIERQFAERNHNGTVGVVDLRTGGLLALVSKPNFEPEFFADPKDPEEWRRLINDPERPLHNKFTQGLYLPGSTFKIVMALAGLQEKAIDTSVMSQCYGRIRIYDRFFHCWKRSGHGNMDIFDALKNSCNVYFYRLGKKLDVDVIARYAGMLGLGSPTSIDLPNEKEGLIPTKAWKLQQLKQKWFPGETISVAIGGGMMNVTPAQLLTMISTVALRGRTPRLHLLKQVEDKRTVTAVFKPEFTEVPIEKQYFELVIEGLHRVVNDGGTGRAARIDGLDICGKTGTQLILSLENPNYKQLVKQKRFTPHSWFVSFAPRNKPEIAMVVFVENGGDAGAVAAPIAREIYKQVFK